MSNESGFLYLTKLFIQSVALYQIVMLAPLNNMTILDDYNFIRMLNGA